MSPTINEPSLEAVLPKSCIKANKQAPCDCHTDTSRQPLDTERQQGSHTYSMSYMSFRKKICTIDKENYLNGLILLLSEKRWPSSLN